MNTDEVVKDFLELDSQIKKISSQKDKIEGRLEHALDQLEKEFGVTSVEEAESLLQKQRKIIQNKWKEFNQEVEKIEHELDANIEED